MNEDRQALILLGPFPEYTDKPTLGTPLGVPVCICASGFHTGGGTGIHPPPPPPPPPQEFIRMYNTLLGVPEYIRVSYKGRGRGHWDPPPPLPQEFICMYGILLGVPECVFVHQGFIQREGGGIPVPPLPLPQEFICMYGILLGVPDVCICAYVCGLQCKHVLCVCE